MKRLLTLVILFCIASVCANAATTIWVPATANIFGAGQAAPPAVTGWDPIQYPGSLPGITPPGLSFNPGPLLVVHVPNMTGSVAYNLTSALKGADGSSSEAVSTTVDSAAGIAAVTKTNRILFLVGVFLTGNAPIAGTEPAGMNADNADNQVNFYPQIGQAFFIGDGFTDSRVQQNFYVPAGASRLYLGFEDGMVFTGAPSWYADNRGGLNATLSVDSLAGDAPEPATMIMIGLPLIGLWFWRRRRA